MTDDKRMIPTDLGILRDPYVILCRIDTQMRYAANDPERFSELCIRREVIAGSMEAIANSVGRFLRGAFA